MEKVLTFLGNASPAAMVAAITLYGIYSIVKLSKEGEGRAGCSRPHDLPCMTC